MDCLLWLHSPFVDPCRNNNEGVVLACKQGHLEILKLLLKDGRIDQSANGDECFIEACANGHVDVMNFLLLNGANAAALDNSAIQLASENGHVKAVKLLLCLSEVVDLLLESNKVLPSDRNNNSLFLAAQSGNMAICKSLLRDSTVREHHGITEIIQIAYQKNHFKIVTLLVQSVRISVHSLKALKKLAMHDGINELIEPLESRIPSNITQIHHAFTIACVKGYLDIVTELYYEIKVAHLHSCFIEAVTAGQTRIVQFLLQDKIINAAYSNNLALRRACANGFHEIVELLFTHPSVYNSDINAALTIACRNGHVKVVEFLVAYTDPSIHDNEALKISIEYADVSITNFLLKKERIQSRLSS
jgi:ankyrin repeat protein